MTRVLRFQRFLSRIDEAGAAADLAGLAAEVGYADQAHLTRESTRLAALARGADKTAALGSSDSAAIQSGGCRSE